MPAPLVRLEGVSRHFGALKALDDVDLEIAARRVARRDGAVGIRQEHARSTCSARSTGPTARSASWVDGVDIAALGESERVRVTGASRSASCSSSSTCFRYLTALENVMVAQHYHSMADDDEARAALDARRGSPTARSTCRPSSRAASSSACASRARSSTSRA